MTACLKWKVFNESIDSEIHEWRFGNSGLQLFGDTLSYRFSSPGPHTIRLVAYDTTCGTSDTTYQVVQFDADWPGPGGQQWPQTHARMAVFG